MDPNWHVCAVETRQQRKNKDKPYFAFKVPRTIADTADSQAMKAAQDEDPTSS
jgi:hypothetical protein